LLARRGENTVRGEDFLMPALKGAFINLGAGVLGGLPNIVIFQFNPDQVVRTISLASPPPRSRGTASSNSRRQPDKPNESMSFTLRLDASDQLAESNPLAAKSGILPALSALELLMVPATSLLIDLNNLGGGPKPYTHPPFKLPTVLFFWGPFRILPVSLDTLTVTETAYDTLLNPTRAEVAVSLQALAPGQLGPKDALARGAYKYTEGVKEVMAALNLADAAASGFKTGASIAL
jgi:hypothetical protein